MIPVSFFVPRDEFCAEINRRVITINQNNGDQSSVGID